MSKFSNVKVLSAITSMPLSATSIAKKLGASKGSVIQDNLDELVANGDIEVDNSGRFPVYTKVSNNNRSVTVTNNTTLSSTDDGECSYIDSKGKAKSVTSDLTLTELYGYKMERPATNKSGQVGTRVTIPSGKKIFIQEGMTLVIINDKPCYIVNSPVRLVEACHSYARDNNIAAYKITQLGVGVINNEDNIKMSDIVSMKIDKIDKGA